MIQTRQELLLDAVTATTTSRSIAADNAGRLSLQFTAASITSGNGVFTVEVSNDGVSWVAYNRLTSNATNTNAQTDVRVASVTLSSNTSAIAFFPPGDTFAFIRVTVTRTTDGAYSATAFIN